MTLPVLISYCLNLIKGNCQSELNHFFQIRDQSDVPLRKVTAAAFSKARLKFSASAFIDLNRQVTTHFYQHTETTTWRGFRVLAVDGVKIHLPNQAVIHDTFGGQSNQHTDEVPMALGSVLYDVSQHIILDAQLAPYRSDERELAFNHLKATQANDLILYDRGYPAFWLIAAHQAQQRDWCLRVKADFNNEVRQFVASGKTQQIVTLTATDQARAKCEETGLPVTAQTVRLIRIKVKHQTYILMTSLRDKQQYPVNAFKALYHARWKIEEGYKRQKSWLEIENFTGQSVLSVQQDYHARILSLNLTAIAVFVAHNHLNPSIGKRRHRYQINFAQALSTMKDTLVKFFYHLVPVQSVIDLLDTLKQSLSVIRPDRRYPRIKRTVTRRKFNPCYKRAM